MRVLKNVTIVIPMNKLILEGSQIYDECKEGDGNCEKGFKMMPFHLA